MFGLILVSRKILPFDFSGKLCTFRANARFRAKPTYRVVAVCVR